MQRHFLALLERSKIKRHCLQRVDSENKQRDIDTRKRNNLKHLKKTSTADYVNGEWTVHAGARGDFVCDDLMLAIATTRRLYICAVYLRYVWLAVAAYTALPAISWVRSDCAWFRCVERSFIALALSRCYKHVNIYHVDWIVILWSIIILLHASYTNR